MASSSSRSSSHKSSSRINLARLVFLISIAVLTSYLYSGFTSELSTYKAYRASRKVLSSVSSLALGTSTAVSTTVSRGVVVKTTTAVDTATPIATATATAGKSVEHEEREDKMTGVARIPNDIFQYSVMSAVKRGLTSGGPPASRLTGYGTHGIGLLASSLTPMALLNSTPYTFSNGRATQITDPSTTLAFVMVTKYQREYAVRISGGGGAAVTLSTLRSVFKSAGPGSSGGNAFTPFSLIGSFSHVKIATDDGSKKIEATRGTIFGIACPPWAKEISYRDIECFFLSEDGERGGRVEGFELGSGVVEWGIGGRYHLGFPFDPEYQDMDLES